MPIFLFHISDHYIVGNNQGKVKENLMSTLFLGNHLKQDENLKVMTWMQSYLFLFHLLLLFFFLT